MIGFLTPRGTRASTPGRKYLGAQNVFCFVPARSCALTPSFTMAKTKKSDTKLTAPFVKGPAAWVLRNKNLMHKHTHAMRKIAKEPFPRGPYPFRHKTLGWVQASFEQQEGQFLKAGKIIHEDGSSIIRLDPCVVETKDTCPETPFEKNAPVTIRCFQEAPTKASPGSAVKTTLVDCGTTKMKYQDFKNMLLNESLNWPQYKDAVSEYQSKTSRTAADSLISLGGHVIPKRVSKRKYHKVCAQLLLLCPAIFCALFVCFLLFFLCPACLLLFYCALSVPCYFFVP